LDDVETVIDVTNTTTLSAKRSTAFFTAVTSNLLSGERDAGVAHHVALSIVGVDRVPLLSGSWMLLSVPRRATAPRSVGHATSGWSR